MHTDFRIQWCKQTPDVNCLKWKLIDCETVMKKAILETLISIQREHFKYENVLSMDN